MLNQLFFFLFFFSKVRVWAKEGGSHYWEMAVAITCGYGGYLLPLLAAHSSFQWILMIFKSPRVTVSAAAIVSAAAVLPTLFNFLGKPLKLVSSNHTWLTYGCGKIFWHPFRWPWVKVIKLPKRNAIYLVPTVKWEPLIQSLLGRYIPLIMLTTWLNFG